jgi:hypothetical protein
MAVPVKVRRSLRVRLVWLIMIDLRRQATVAVENRPAVHDDAGAATPSNRVAMNFDEPTRL